MKPKLTAQRIVSLTIGAILLGGTAGAHAGDLVDKDRNGHRSMTVQYGDVDLSNPQGIEALYHRLRAAAEKVCGPEKHHRLISVRLAWQECYASTIDEAVAFVEQPTLTQLHFAETGREVAKPSQVAKSR